METGVVVGSHSVGGMCFFSGIVGVLLVQILSSPIAGANQMNINKGGINYQNCCRYANFYVFNFKFKRIYYVHGFGCACARTCVSVCVLFI